MCATQKHACFNLAVVILTLITILSLLPALGIAAFGGLGLLGLLGFGVLFFRKASTQVIMDERDVLIQRRSVVAAFTVFWLTFVGAAVFAPFYYGERGAVPILVVEFAVWFGFMLFTAVQAIATLVQYGREGFNAGNQ